MTVSALFTHLTNAFGIKEKSQDLDINISFNSISGISWMTVHDPIVEPLFINIYDSSMIFLGSLKAQNGITNLPSLPENKYYFKVIAGDGSLVKKGRFNVVYK